MLGLGVAMAGCSAHATPLAIETKLANAAKDVVIPLEAEKLANPTPDTALTLAQGRKVFVERCALCHSRDGHSQNPLGRAMYPPAMDLTSPHVQGWKDAELYWIIQNGIRLTGMPGWQDMVSAPDTWKLVRYIHALPRMTPARLAQLDALEAPRPPEPPAAPRRKATPAARLAAEMAYGRRILRQEGCLQCHAYGDEGEDMAPDLSREGNRKRTAAWLAGHFADPEKFSPGSEMPAFDHLTQAQLRALVALLENAHG